MLSDLTLHSSLWDQSKVGVTPEHHSRRFPDMEASFFVEESPEPISGADEQTVCREKEVSSTLLNA